MAIKSHTVSEVEKGIVSNLPSTKVLWATGNNVRITPGTVYKTPGKTELVTAPGGLPVRATFTFIDALSVMRTVVCCDSAVYTYDSTFETYATITPTPAPTGGASDIWQLELVAGLPILSNGKDPIWKWVPGDSALTPLVSAPTWAKHIVSCMNRLVVSNLAEGGVTNIGRVCWSEQGNPENWVVGTDAKSGFQDIVGYNTGVEAQSNIKGMIARGHEVFLFAERNLWKCDFSAAARNFIRVNPATEILSKRAVCFRDEKFYFIGKKDLYFSGGGDPTPFGFPIRKELFDNLNEDAADAAFAFAPYAKPEAWFCIPTGASTVANKAFIYNFETKSFSIHDVDFSCHGEALYTKVPYDILGSATGKIFRMDSGFDNDGVAIDGRIETGDMIFKEPDVMKRISDVIPDFMVQDTVSEVMVQIGVRNRLADDLKWSDPVPFTIGVSERCDFNDFRREGKLVRVRFYSDQLGSPWELSGFTVNYERGGTR